MERQVLAWLEQWADSEVDTAIALEATAWCRALPGLAARIQHDVWWELLGRLVATAQEAQSMPPSADPLTRQLLAGELAWSLGCFFPEIQPCRRLARPARKAISAGLTGLTDAQGLLPGRYLPVLRPLLACWTRCAALGRAAGERPWDKAARQRYRRLVQNALRFARHDGSHAFCDGAAAGQNYAELLAAARMGGNAEQDVARKALRGAKRGRKWNRPGRVPVLALPEPAVHSEPSASAVLRRTWKPGSERLAVVYEGREVHTELCAGREMFWSGVWGLEVRLDDAAVAATSDWREVVWVSDGDVDYLEVEADFEGNLLVQRHMLLARGDCFLLMADSILGRGPGRIEYGGRMPLRPGVRFEPAAETHEGFLVGRKRRALVLPLALPEWRSDSEGLALPARSLDGPRGEMGPRRRDELLWTAAGLELRQSAQGSALMAPWFVDLAPGRHGRPFTWRRLTVAESLRAVARDVAVGYRVAVGKRQWLIYRSLAARASRTVLGQNFASEMVVARLARTGEHEALLELE